MNHLTRLLLIIVVVCPLCSFAKIPDEECVRWFNEAGGVAGAKGCELKCSTFMIGMNTFMCVEQCGLLCEEPGGPSSKGRLLYYPGLTPAERKLVEKYPKDAINVFVQKTRAEFSSIRNFPDQGMNDESDAF